MTRTLWRDPRSAQAVSRNVQVRGDQRCEAAAHTACHLTVPLRHRAAVEADTGARQAGHRAARPTGRMDAGTSRYTNLSATQAQTVHPVPLRPCDHADQQSEGDVVTNVVTNGVADRRAGRTAF